MKMFLQRLRRENFKTLGVVVLASGLCLVAAATWAFDSPGLDLQIAPPQEHAGLVFDQGEAVQLIMVIRNEAGMDLYTERGFSQLELHRFLSLVDPGGTKHFLGGEVTSGDAPPPFFLPKRQLVPAEKLPAGWIKSVTIDDLTELFPVMRTTPGWYTLEVNVPYVRLHWTIESEKVGLLGDAADPENWSGTVDSNRLQLQIVLPAGMTGAHLKVYVKDQGQQPAAPLNQVPVKVFGAAEVGGLGPDQAWTQATPVLTGTTNPEGLAVWTEDLCQPQKDYRAIAYYQEEYAEVSFSGSRDSWAEQCAGTIEKIIYLGEAQQPAVEGDLDGDGDVDRNDIKIILAHRNQPATTCPACDLDGDGVVTVLDARKLVLLCTRPRCATEKNRKSR